MDKQPHPRSNIAIARLLLARGQITSAQYDIWYRAAVLKQTIKAISKVYPDNSPRTLFRWRNRTTTLIEEVFDLDERIEIERKVLPQDDGDDVRFEITVASGSDVWDVDDTTAMKADRKIGDTLDKSNSVTVR